MARPGASRPATHNASRFAKVPPLVKCPRCSSHPNILASAATASSSIAELARPPSNAWLVGFSCIAGAYAAADFDSGMLHARSLYNTLMAEDTVTTARDRFLAGDRTDPADDGDTIR